MTAWLAGGVFAAATDTDDDFAELRKLVDDVGRRSFDARLGQRTLPEVFDRQLWRTLEDTGLSRPTSSGDADAGAVAIVLRGLACQAAAAPIAETDLLAGWLGARAGIDLPAEGPLTVAIADADAEAGRVAGTATSVPWLAPATAVLLAVRAGDALLVAAVDSKDLQIIEAHNLAGEPRDSIAFDLPADAFRTLAGAVAVELTRRGAWARCVQTIGALDAAAELSVAHTRERVQFGRPLSTFQSVQHLLADIAGQIERARAATALAVAAATDHGFGSPQADYAVTVAKVVLGRVVPYVATIAHQLHGAIGVTIEHPLWLSTTRAHSWIEEFGSTGHYARRLGRITLAATRDGTEPWDTIIGNDWHGWG